MSIGHNNEARSTNFLFTVGDERELTLSVQSSNVNDLTMGFAPFPTSRKDLKVPTNKVDNSPLTIDFVVSDDYNEWIEIYKWMLRCKNHNDSHLTQVKPCSLITLDSQNRSSVEFIYGDAFPIELGSLQFAVNTEDSPVVVGTATFMFNTFKIVLPNGETIDEYYIG